jgi:anti-sigma B factor antagonist
MQTKTELKIIPRILGGDEQIALLMLDGYIDSTNAVLLKKEIERLGKKIFRFIINFTGVEYVSSAGWGVILSRIREFREQKGDIVFAKMSEEVHSVFELLELNQVIKHFTTIEDALRHFGMTEPISLAELVEAGLDEQKSQKDRKLTVEDAIRIIVCENPLLGSSQIKKTLSSPVYGFKRLTTLKVYFLLRRLGLHTREKKLYYAWQHLIKKTRT